VLVHEEVDDVDLSKDLEDRAVVNQSDEVDLHMNNLVDMALMDE